MSSTFDKESDMGSGKKKGDNKGFKIKQDFDDVRQCTAF